MTAQLREVIYTDRKVGSGESEDDAVHRHHQHWTPDGELIVEWCDIEQDCGHRPPEFESEATQLPEDLDDPEGIRLTRDG